MKTTTANMSSNHNSLTITAPKEKKMKRFYFSFVMCVLAVIGSVGAANAAQVTVNYQTFPAATVLDSNVISTGCESATADTFTGYEFLFWDNQGSLSWNSTVSICVGSGNTVATAWYVETGDGLCPKSGCYVTTFAFSIDHDEVLPSSQTAIASVAPNSPVVWTLPMTTVNTNQAESITADSSVAFPGYSAEPFRYWQQLGTTTQTPIGAVYAAAENSTAWVVAFYGPDPCQTLRNELASCLEGDGSGGKLNCAPFGKALELCEIANREPLIY